MKRLGEVITEKTITEEFCLSCIKDAMHGKTTRPDVASIAGNIEEYAYILRQMILKQDGMDYYPAPYTFQTRQENGKMRDLCKPQFWPDQCIHHVLIKSIQDFLMNRMDTYACASIPGRGIDYGLNALERFVQKSKYADTKYTLKMDIKKCFDSMSNVMIYSHMKNMIKDKRWLELFHKVIMNHPTLPIGLYISAWILNVILKKLDDFIRSHDVCKYYIRYMDDMVVLGPNKRHLYRLQEEISAKLMEWYGLEMKGNWKIFLTDCGPRGKKHRNGIDMLGFRVYRDKTILRKKNFVGIRKGYFHFKKMQRKGKKISTKEVMSFVSRTAHTGRVCNSTLNKKYLFPIQIQSLIDQISIDFKKKFGFDLKKNKKMSYFVRKSIEEDLESGKKQIRPSKKRREKRKKEQDRVNNLKDMNKKFSEFICLWDVVRYYEVGRFSLSKELTKYINDSNKLSKQYSRIVQQVREDDMKDPMPVESNVGRFIPNYGLPEKTTNTTEDTKDTTKKPPKAKVKSYSEAMIRKEKKAIRRFVPPIKEKISSNSKDFPFGPEPTVPIPV